MYGNDRPMPCSEQYTLQVGCTIGQRFSELHMAQTQQMVLLKMIFNCLAVTFFLDYSFQCAARKFLLKKSKTTYS